MNDFFSKITQIKAKIPEAMKRIPGIIKNEGILFIADNFKNEGFEKTTGSYEPWPTRKSDKSKKKGIGEKRGGKLKQSWKQNTSISATQVAFTSALPYAEIQNDGGKTSAHVIKAKNAKALKIGDSYFKSVKHPGSDIPASPMIGPSAALDGRIEKKIDELANKIFE